MKLMSFFVKLNIRKVGCTFQIIVRPYLGLQMFILFCRFEQIWFANKVARGQNLLFKGTYLNGHKL